MSQAKDGDTVHVHYTGSFDDGEKFDSSHDDGEGPLEITLGAGHVIPGFDAAVLGMSTGEKKKVRIPCDQAYGLPESHKVFPVPRAELPEDFEPTVGAALMMSGEDEEGNPSEDEEEALQVVVIAIDDENVTLDANHPLAGRDLNFDLELVAIL